MSSCPIWLRQLLILGQAHRMHVLVTGANSQLAQALAHTQASFQGLQVIFAPKSALDITNLAQVRAYLQDHAIDYLINCAAYTQVDEAEHDQASAFAVNTVGPQYLASLAQAMNFTLLHISTDHVFGGEIAHPYTESMLARPVNYYGQSKLAGEKAILAHNPAAYIIRTAWLYRGIGNNFLTRFVNKASKQNTISMVYDQIGSPTYADDLAMAIWAIITKLHHAPKQYLPGIYHYANEGVASRYDFAWAIKQYASLDCQLIPGLSKALPQVAARPAYSVLNKDKIKKTFDLTIAHWQDSLSDCMQQFNTIP